MANLEALARVAGLVRHFHPSDSAATADWPSTLWQVVERVESATSANDLRDRMAPWLGKLAPTARLWVTESGPPEPTHLAAAGEPSEPVAVLRWHHRGYGQEDSSGGLSPYRSARQERTIERLLVAPPSRYGAGAST